MLPAARQLAYGQVMSSKKMVVTRQSTRALTVSSGMSRRTYGGNGASAPQFVGGLPVVPGV